MARRELADSGKAHNNVEALQTQLNQLKDECSAAMYSGDMATAGGLMERMKRMEAQLSRGTVVEEITASIGFEMWYFGALLYQLCTEDGETLWKANQADNIGPEEMQDLAYRWVRIHTFALFCRDWN